MWTTCYSSYNLFHGMLENCEVKIKAWFTRNKTVFDISCEKISYEFPHELLKNLRLSILGNKDFLTIKVIAILLRTKPCFLSLVL